MDWGKAIRDAERRLGREAFVASQRQQALIRMLVAALFLGYLALAAPGFSDWRALVLGSWAAHLAWNLAGMLWWIPKQPISPVRVALGIALDVYLIAMAMFVDGGITSPVAVLLISPMIANGMRYGRAWLVYAAVLATIALGAVGLLAHNLHAPADWLRLAAEIFGLNYIGFYAMSILAAREREVQARAALESSVRRMLAGWPLAALVVRASKEGRVRVVEANEGVRALGLEPELLRGAKLKRICAPDDEAVLLALCEEAAHKGSAHGFVRLRGDRGEVPVEVRAFSLPVGGRCEVLVLLEDVAQALRERKALADAQKRAYAAALAAGVAHDFRNLLTAIMGEAELARMDTKAPDVRARLARIVDAAEHGARVINELLAFTRGREERLGPVQLAEVLPPMLELVRVQLGPGVRLETEMEPGLPLVLADPAKVQQMLLNLVDNAVQAMEGEGVLTVRLIRRGARVALEVQDTGPGVPSAHLPHLFQPFWTTRAKQGGTGLGLAMVQTLAAWQDAEVEVDSHPGQGACFRILFRPAVRPRTASQDRKQETASGQPLAGKRVLVVDDEPFVLEAVAAMLERMGAETLRAASGEEALQAIAADCGRLDAALLDWRMPGISGGELARRLHERCPDLPIVFATGYPEEVEEEGTGAFAVLTKPVRATELARTLSEAMHAG